ncbi:MAG: hypothetical protein IPK35_02580 [Saprospiraceae bacterium]|nr:hypothetical protein [Saprospiraceae bacterium]
MPKPLIIYQADQEVIGKHLRSNEWVMYSGRLVIYDRKLNPIVLSLKSEICDSFIGEFMEDKKNLKVIQYLKYMESWRNGIIKTV